VVTSQFGEIDFSADNIGIEIIKSLYENGFPYLEMAEVGKSEVYGINTIIEKPPINKPTKVKKSSKIFLP